jgi:hypothetical protein
MNPFKKGDRIAMYWGTENRAVGEVFAVGVNDVTIKNPDISSGWLMAHYKACRRLKKKERRTVWVKFEETFGYVSETNKIRPKICHHDDPTWCHENCFSPGWIKFVEAK